MMSKKHKMNNNNNNNKKIKYKQNILNNQPQISTNMKILIIKIIIMILILKINIIQIFLIKMVSKKWSRNRRIANKLP